MVIDWTEIKRRIAMGNTNSIKHLPSKRFVFCVQKYVFNSPEIFKGYCNIKEVFQKLEIRKFVSLPAFSEVMQ